jgi:DNA polymerase-4
MPLTLHSFPKAVLHVDCDAFFASVEQAMNPELRGKPVITGKERGIASAMSYEAKRRGVVRGMRLFEVKKICPDAVILPSDYETYSLFSKRFYGILRRFTPDVEEYSIDEAFAEISGLRRIYRTSYEEIALMMKKAVESELGITVSIGLSLTKSLAKICSKENKPSGFTCVKGRDLHHFLKKIPTGRVCGFGPNSTALLNKNGVCTVYDYVTRPEIFAKNLLGKAGVDLWHELRGEAVYPIVTGENSAHQVSLSKTKTFTPPSNDKEFVKAQLLRNIESAFIKLRRHRLRTKTISILLVNQEFRGNGLSADLSRSTASTHEAVDTASKLFEKIFDPAWNYRKTGVVLNNLEVEKEAQADLFEDTCHIKALREISRVIDEVNAVYGKHALHLGSTDCLNKFSRHLGDRGDVASRKKNLLNGETFRRRLRIPLWNVKV